LGVLLKIKFEPDQLIILCDCRQTLLLNISLKSGNHFIAGFDSTSEGEIIPLSGVSKSGAGAIIQAGGAGRFVGVRAGCVELQPLTASKNIRGCFFDVSARRDVTDGMRLTPFFGGYVRYGMVGEELFLNGPPIRFCHDFPSGQNIE
jgi:hypothetical protein